MNPASDVRRPDFLLVGAARAGTTTLAQWLKGHPGCFVSPEKEVFFFDSDDQWARGLGWYSSRFARARPDQLVGEASTSYLYYPIAAERMAEVVPDARLVAILRHPVDRAYSHYCFVRMLRDAYGPGETRDFLTAVTSELDGYVERTREYVSRGHYAEQLKRLLAFFREEQLLVLLFDDLLRHPQTVWVQLTTHLGLTSQPEPVDLVSPVNATQDYRFRLLEVLARRSRRRWDRPPSSLSARIDAWNHRRLPPMSTTARELLVAHYRPHNGELADLLGRDLTEWDG